MKRSAFSLVEVVASVVVLGVVAAVLLPLISGVAGAYAAAADVREKTERVAFALDRCVRLLRETPAGADASTVAIDVAADDLVRFSDGRGLELSGDVLLLRTPSGTSPLCRAVSSFQVSFLAADGVTSTLAVPADTHSYHVSIVADGVTLGAAAFPRCRMIKP